MSKRQLIKKYSALEALLETQKISDVEIHDSSDSTDDEYNSEEENMFWWTRIQLMSKLLCFFCILNNSAAQNGRDSPHSNRLDVSM